MTAESAAASTVPVDGARLRHVLGHFCTGVTVITAFDGADPHGFACQSVTSLSLDPPLVSFCPAKTSSSWPKMRDAGRLLINVLAHDQLALCQSFAVSGGDKFAGVDWTPGGNGAPMLPGTLAAIEIDLELEHDAGDHTIVIGRVTELDVHRDTDPLLFYRGGFGKFAPGDC